MLGGSVSHNGMMHNRGSPKDYDNWATLLDDDSFNYTNVLKYYKRMENFTGQKYGDVGDGNQIIKMDYLQFHFKNLIFSCVNEIR